MALVGKEPACQCMTHRDECSIPGLGRSPGGGHGNPLQYSGLENPTGGRAWVTVSDMPERTLQACEPQILIILSVLIYCLHHLFSILFLGRRKPFNSFILSHKSILVWDLRVSTFRVVWWNLIKYYEDLVWYLRFVSLTL